jgi:hypothetical protein
MIIFQYAHSYREMFALCDCDVDPDKGWTHKTRTKRSYRIR